MTKLLSYATALAVIAGWAACGSGGELVWERYFGGLASADVTEQACLSTAGQYRLEFGRTHFRNSTVTLSHVAEGGIAPGVRSVDVVLQFDGNTDRLDAEQLADLEARCYDVRVMNGAVTSGTWDARLGRPGTGGSRWIGGGEDLSHRKLSIGGGRRYFCFKSGVVA